MKKIIILLISLLIVGTPIDLTIAQEECEEEWTCTDWSLCNEEGVATRRCTDRNRCGTEIYKPLESQPCSTEEKVESEEIRETNKERVMIIVPILLIILIIGTIYYLKKRKK